MYSKRSTQEIALNCEHILGDWRTAKKRHREGEKIFSDYYGQQYLSGIMPEKPANLRQRQTLDMQLLAAFGKLIIRSPALLAGSLTLARRTGMSAPEVLHNLGRLSGHLGEAAVSDESIQSSPNRPNETQ
jgi:hypothetical protein